MRKDRTCCKVLASNLNKVVAYLIHTSCFVSLWVCSGQLMQPFYLLLLIVPLKHSISSKLYVKKDAKFCLKHLSCFGALILTLTAACSADATSQFVANLYSKMKVLVCWCSKFLDCRELCILILVKCLCHLSLLSIWRIPIEKGISYQGCDA